MSEPPVAPAQAARVALPFVIVTLVWGSTWLVIRDQLGLVPVSWSVAYRFVVASAAMFAVSAITRQPLAFNRRDWPLLALIGLAQFVLNFNFVYRAEAHITSGLVAVVFALLIVPNAVLGRIFLGQSLSRPFMAGSAVALVGVALLFEQELARDGAGVDETLYGIAITLAGVLSASVANVLQGTDRVKRLPMAPMLAWSMLVGAIANAGWALASAGPPVIDPRPGYIAGVLYLGLAASALAFTLYFGVVRAIGPARAAYSGVLVPILAMALSTLFEGYRWSAQAGVAAVLTMAGLVIALRARRPAR
ncbi:EamA family transporter [Sphingomonas sp. 1P06PA]|uniref:DMT family transporter n=1 Tax=Sphingomonas sp. 1P06PA TaxID=554121 RepID=UPI0039A6A6F0